MGMQPDRRSRCGSGFRKRAADDVVHIGRQSRGGRNATQGGLGLRTTLAFQHAPGPERGGEPRGDLRVFCIQRQHGIGHEIIAKAIGAVELRGVAMCEGTDQSAYAVRIVHRKCRMRSEGAYAVERAGLRDHRLQAHQICR